jgi:predicted nucleotidyltransferase
MKNSLIDISGKIEQSIVETIMLMDKIANSFNIPFFIIGAKARDLIFSAIFNIPTIRATLDVDFATRVKDWEEFDRFVKALQASGKFQIHKSIRHRLSHENGTQIDVIPFGKIEKSPGSLSWPLTEEIIMSTIGFEDAFNSSVTVRFSKEPQCDVRVCTASGLAIMKLISWDQKYPERNNDAKDLLFILTNYIHLENENRLYNSDKDITQEDGFDFGMAGPRLLGRDIAKIASSETIDVVHNLLVKETKHDSNFRLIGDMMRNRFTDNYSVESALSLLKHMKKGIGDVISKASFEKS